MRRPVIFGVVFGLAFCGSLKVSAQNAPTKDQSLDIIIDRVAQDLFEDARGTDLIIREIPHRRKNRNEVADWEMLTEVQKQRFRARASRTLANSVRGTSI